MTDILELARQSGFLPEYIFNRENRFAKLEALLREKFIAELEQTGWQFYQDGEWFNGSDKNNHKQNTIDGGYQVRELYALPKDKD